MNHFSLFVSIDIAKSMSQRFVLYLPMPWLGDLSVDDLARGYLWIIVVSGSEKFIYAKLRVKEVTVERGSIADGLVVLGDQASSDYYWDPGEDVEVLSPDLPILSVSLVSQLESHYVMQLEKLVNSSKKVVYKVPAAVIREEESYVATDEDYARNLARLESHYRKTRLFQSIPVTHAHPPMWSPYLSLAVAVLESIMQGVQGDVRALAESFSKSRNVGFDFDFSVVEEGELHARTFSAPQGVVGSREILDKLQSAEGKHQKMLAELASVSRSCGVTPLQSNSVDLLLEGEDDILICEVKSSSDVNAASQCRKAISQLVEYRYFMSRVSSKNICPVLIIEDSRNETIIDDYELIMGSIDTRVFKYKKELEWPHRCLGFQDLVENLASH